MLINIYFVTFQAILKNEACASNCEIMYMFIDVYILKSWCYSPCFINEKTDLRIQQVLITEAVVA